MSKSKMKSKSTLIKIAENKKYMDREKEIIKHGTYCHKKGRELGAKEAIEEIIMRRELKFKCLGCGKDLSYKIMNRKIRIHLCEDCRKIYMTRYAELETAGKTWEKETTYNMFPKYKCKCCGKMRCIFNLDMCRSCYKRLQEETKDLESWIKRLKPKAKKDLKMRCK